MSILLKDFVRIILEGSDQNTASNKIYYHGSKKELEKFTLDQEQWTAFDGKKIDRPVWLTPSKKFAKLHAGAHGWIYTVEVNVNKTFPDKELYEESGNYYVPTDFGEKIIQDIMKSNMFGVENDDWDDAEEYLQVIDRLNYDIIETKDFTDWLKGNGYDSSEIRGDGPTNLLVFDPNKIRIIKKEKP